MADPNNPIHADDIHFQDRGGCFVLVDPARPEGRRDVAAAWQETPSRWRWRRTDQAVPGPHPTATCRDVALEAMLGAHAGDPEVARRLDAQRPRHSFGSPQIVRA